MPRPHRVIKPKVQQHQLPGVKPVCYATPAYGRTFSTPENLRIAWNSGKDFKMLGGPYFSVRDRDTLKPLYDMIELSCLGPRGEVTVHISLKD